MSKYIIVYTKQVQKDAKKIASSGLRYNAESLLEILVKDPFKEYSPFEKLQDDLLVAYSRRINIQHRLVYQVLNEISTVKVIRMWPHDEYGRIML